MERYIVSARKYRPYSFESLIGQENIVRTLKNSILRGQLAHAYLFCGPRGVGKTTTARIFARTINCLNPTEITEACGSCESCISFAEGRSYSIHELDAASNNSVDDIRQLNEVVRIPPQIGRYSVYIIDEVHMLSAAAFNAFLKTLEEPPAHAVFILATTEKHKILPTILSRCQTYDFNCISVGDMVKNLEDISDKEGVTAEKDALHIIGQKADGSMRDALTLFDQMVAFCGNEISYTQVISNLNVLDYDYYFRLTDHFLNNRYSEPLLIFDEILSKGFNALHFIGGLSTHFRDLLISKESKTAKLLELPPSLITRYSEQAARCTPGFLYDALSITTTCEAGFKSSGNQRLHIEFALCALSRINRSSQITAAAQNLNETKKTESACSDVEVPNKSKSKNNNSTNIANIANSSSASNSSSDSNSSNGSNHSNINSNSNSNGNGNGSNGSMSVNGGFNNSYNHTRPSTTSLKELLKSAEEKIVSTVKSNSNDIGEDGISEEKLISVWNRMADSESALPNLATSIRQAKPVLREDNTIIFTVSNQMQKDWIEKKCLFRLTAFLRANLNNRYVKMEIEVAPEEKSEKKLYMPDEKAKFLLENSEELRELKKDLKLEIK